MQLGSIRSITIPFACQASPTAPAKSRSRVLWIWHCYSGKWWTSRKPAGLGQAPGRYSSAQLQSTTSVAPRRWGHLVPTTICCFSQMSMVQLKSHLSINQSFYLILDQCTSDGHIQTLGMSEPGLASE